MLIRNSNVSTRRGFFSKAGAVTLSASAIALLGGRFNLASAQAAAKNGQDVAILNVALGLEHQAIGAYQLGAESKLLTAPVLATAVMFQGHHKGHRDALAAAVTKLGGKPVEAQSLQQYATQLDAAKLKTQEDVLKLALGLERGAIEAYLGVIPKFDDRELSKVSGRLAADEVEHWTVLQQVLGMPLPPQTLIFGA